MFFSRKCLSLSLAILIAPSVAALGQEKKLPADSELQAHEMAKLFTLRIQPMLTEKCAGCHGSDESDIKGDYDIRTREAVLKGGESEEPAVVPGKPEESPFYLAVTWDSLEMPPKENDRLTQEQTEWVRQWIEAGAVWPDEATQEKIRQEEWSVAENDEGVLVSTSGGLGNEWTYRRYLKDDIWAFQPIQRDQKHSSVDAFIQEKLDAADLEAAPEAAPEDLVRRAYFDLIGLPPSPSQSRAFLRAWSKDPVAAWSTLIDSLLESPHYGERWAQHWLDVARYADTGGLSNDYERSNAWRYRDYVVRAFNSDKPYNEFVMEQLAGDELRPDDIEARIATGFLRMGPWDTAMIPKDEARQIFLDDVVHSVGQTFLAMPMRCCKCHDHKFDPIPTQDYYRVYATFAATQPAEMPAAFLPYENLADIGPEETLVNSLHKFADDERLVIFNKQEAAAKKWYAEHELEYKDPNARKNDPEDQKPPRHVGLNETEKGQLKVREQDVWIWNRRKERYQPMLQSVYNGPNTGQNAKKLRAPGKKNDSWTPESYIYMGGSYSATGEPVTPGVLSACSVEAEGAPTSDPFALPTTQSGRRLAFAKWVANPANPLSTRTIVNRLWQHHFGTGIVKTANNFGAKGDSPSHPELLDWLTGEFLDGGWKIKRMHKLIMMSDTYRRSTRHSDSEKLATVDPDGRLLARFKPRRLSAEELRDACLSVNGELNRSVGGFPARPEINMEVALQPRMIQFSLAPAYQPSKTPQQRNRRSIYAYRIRGQADPFLEVMNQPNPNDSCELRDSAAVSPQAFTLLNSDVMTDRSIGLALRLEGEAKNLKKQIDLAFNLTVGHSPSAEQLKSMVKYVRSMREYHAETTPEPTTYPTKVVRSLVEEFSGDIFEYDEWLPVFENYVPDPKPSTVSANTRALADMCLLLFNSNEFVYVY